MRDARNFRGRRAGAPHWLAFERQGLDDACARYEWTITTGMIACAAVIPLALLCGKVHGIPFCWRLLDGSFGAFGIVPLGYGRKLTRRMAGLSST